MIPVDIYHISDSCALLMLLCHQFYLPIVYALLEMKPKYEKGRGLRVKLVR